MKKCTRSLLSVVLVLCLVLSMFTGAFAAPAATQIVTTPSGYTSAAQVNYTTAGGYIVNWGARGEDCGFLTTYAQKFYTGSYTYSTLSKVAGGTSTSNAPSSKLYSSLQTLMESNHTYFTKYGDSSSSRDCRKLYQYTDCMLGDYSYVSTLYRGLKVGGVWDSGVSYNQEHIWPQSKCIGSSSEDVGDIMQLRPANPSENSSRGNTAYGESSGFYDPGISVRGDCARTVLYMYVRWGNTDYMWGTDGVIESLDVLLDWIKEDPVDTWEMGHNDAVQSITGTRNVFVDYPEYAYLLFGRSVPADLTTPATGGNPNGGSSGGTEAPSGEVATLITNASSLQTGDRIIIAALDYDVAMGTTQNTNNRSQATVTKSDDKLYYGSDVQVLTLVSGNTSGTFGLDAGGGQYLSAASSSANNLKTKTTLDDNGSWMVSIDASTGAATVTATGSYTRNQMRYNMSSDIFSCYAAGNSQKEIAIYRVGSAGGSGGGTTTPTGNSATLVTKVSSLKAGDQILIAAADYDVVLSTTQNINNRGQASVTKSGSTLNYGADAQVLTLETGSVSGTFALRAGTGKYLYAPSSSSNHLKTTTEIADNASWTITIDSSTGVATLSANGGVTRNLMRYNSSSGLFSCYAANNTQKDLAIYRIGSTTTSCSHSYSSKVTTAATCTASGIRTYTCTKCGDAYTQTIAATGHSYSSRVTAATCMAQGYTTYTCNSCGSSYKSDYTAVAGHSYTSKVTAATCTAQGYTTYTCNSCGSSYKGDYTAVAGHNYTSKVTKAATCTASGVRTYTCSGCSGSYTETIAATGHRYSNGKCTVCGVSDPNCSHSYSSKVTQAATCTSAGVKTYTCSKCGDVYTQTIAATGHSYTSKVTAATCTAQGYTTYTCTACGYNYTGNYTAATGHNYVGGSCTNCGSGCSHSYSSKVTQAATCTSAGVKTYTCSKCSYSYTEAISATGHRYSNGVCTLCGVADPSVPADNVYYLVGYINGADYGCESDWENMGSYRFVNNKLVATFTQDSYVFVKTQDNANWYMTQSYCTESSTVFYNTSTGAYEKMFVPGNVELTFTLTENADGSLTISYSTGAVQASIVPTLTLKAPTLEFKDMITVNAFYTAENTQDVEEMGMITYSSKVSNWSVATAENVIPGATYDSGSGRYYASSQGIHGKYLGDAVYLAVYARLKDGNYAYSKLASYSAVQYATSQLKNSTDIKLKQLVVAMLNYGAEAQRYFGHNTGSLANASLSADQLALSNAYNSSMVAAVPSATGTKQGSFANNQGFSGRKPAISFEGAFCINYFFTPSYAPDSGITLYYWTAEDYNSGSVLTTANATGSLRLQGSGTGEYRGDITGIAAKALSEAVYVAAVYRSGGSIWTSGVLGYSIGSYCSSQASKGGNIADLAKATAVYGYHAKQYFG